MKIGFLFFVSIFSFYYTIAQTERIDFENITTAMGLSHGDVTCFCQDHEGYMWIGTADGLNKYDGIEFQVFKKDLKDSASLSNSYINCVYEDKQNNVWIGVFDGLYKYNRDINKLGKVPFIDIH